jgi:hypothetical protein
MDARTMQKPTLYEQSFHHGNPAFDKQKIQ